MSPLKIKFKKDIDINRIPKAIEISRKFYFSDSEYQNSKTIWSIKLFAKSPRAQKFKEIEGGSEEWMFIVQVFRNRIPKICYFPTFLFDFPERIYLNFPPPSENSSVNDYYIRIIQDVLDTIGDDLSIKRHIIDRVESYDQENPWDFFDFIKSDTKKRIDHVMEIISDRITTTVFNLWDQIFHVDLSGKSISMNWGVDKPIENGLKPIYIEFFVKDG